MRNRFSGSVCAQVSDGQVEMSFGIFWIQFQSLGIFPNRLVHPALLHKDVAQIVMGLRVLGIKSKTTLIFPNCFLGFVLRGQGIAQVAVGAGVIGPGFAEPDENG